MALHVSSLRQILGREEAPAPLRPRTPLCGEDDSRLSERLLTGENKHK